MRLNLLSEEKSVSAGSLFHVLITPWLHAHRKKWCEYFCYLISWTTCTYGLWFALQLRIQRYHLRLQQQCQKQFYNTIRGQLIVGDVLGFVSLSTANATCREDCEAHVISLWNAVTYYSVHSLHMIMLMFYCVKLSSRPGPILSVFHTLIVHS